MRGVAIHHLRQVAVADMPTVLYDGPYALVFFSSDGREPLYIHVKRDRHIAKFWLDPINLAKNRGFTAQELRQIERVVEKHRERLMEAWYDYFGAGG